MSNPLVQLSDADLKAISAALKSRRLRPEYTTLKLRSLIDASRASDVAAHLNQLAENDFVEKQIFCVIQTILDDRQSGRGSEPPIDLVTSGPEAPGVANRDTSVVVREMFTHAKKSVTVIGYAVYQGQQVFEALAKRMEEDPDLNVRFFLDIARSNQDTTSSEILVSKYAHRFKSKQWPTGSRLPEVYYDPRSISDDEKVRSSLHAKCVVIDGRDVFVSSANFTKAGQERNIEVGLRIESQWLAARLTNHFESLISGDLVRRAF
ncbi:MAG: DISARM system phospholipase D-like protein DrmC [Rubripirellula sp.]|nr:DISARM system phospholipase D-like protein DrmC [Rubripirellula sp.]